MHDAIRMAWGDETSKGSIEHDVSPTSLFPKDIMMLPWVSVRLVVAVVDDTRRHFATTAWEPPGFQRFVESLRFVLAFPTCEFLGAEAETCPWPIAVSSVLENP